ncbi:MAG: DUF72 domain-containing protein [Nannocystaceae bacterium]|nr:DUF72 domain-containing protein [Nannocystaceae bacterium]
MAIEGVHLGCPVWGRKDWVGELFRPGTQQPQFLETYAKVFNAVEGNTTFYATPSPDTVARWRDHTPSTFRFCFKLPRTVTHDRLLANARREAEGFIERMAPLGPRLGPFMIQLPPHFGPQHLPRLEDFVGTLPGEYTYAVEVRHPGLLAGTPCQELDAVLHEQGNRSRGARHARAPCAAAGRPAPCGLAIAQTQAALARRPRRSAPDRAFCGRPGSGEERGAALGLGRPGRAMVGAGAAPVRLHALPQRFFRARARADVHGDVVRPCQRRRDASVARRAGPQAPDGAVLDGASVALCPSSRSCPNPTAS